MKSLSEIADIEIIGPLKNRWRFPLKIVTKIHDTLSKKKFSPNHIPLVAKGYARQIEKKLKNRDFDYIICPAGSEIIAYLNTDIPIVYISDSTFACMIDYYPGFSNLIEISKKWGMEIERRAIERASLVICTSNWALGYVTDVYNCPKEKVEVISLGSNMEVLPEREKIIRIRQEKIEKLKLVWVGVDWERKGGQIAYDAMVEMNRRGYNTELIVCGCTPPKENTHKGLKCEGFLNKNNLEELNKINEIYLDSNIFIMPTKQECAGIVFSEASSYGLPILTFDTGGVSNYVENKVNGFRLPLGSSYIEFVDKLEELIINKNLYTQISREALDKYERELNWGVWTQVLRDRLKKIEEPFLEDDVLESPETDAASESGERQRLFENFVSLSFLEIASFVLPLITLPYLFRVLGPAKFGIVAFFQALNNYFVLVTEYGFNLTATKDVSINRENKAVLSRILTDVTITRISLAVLTFIVMIIIVCFIDRFRDEKLIAFLFFGVVIGQVLFPQWIFQGMERMKYITILSVLSKLVFTILVFVFVKEENHYFLVPMFTSIGFIITGLLSMFIIIRHFDIKFKKPKISGILFQLKNGWQVFQSSVSISFYSTISILILGFFASNEIVGYYSAASRLIDAAKRSIRPIVQTLFPYVTKKVSVSREAGLIVIRKTLKYLIPFMATISISLFILAPLIINIIYSVSTEEIITVFRILCWTPFVISFSAVFGLQTMIPLGMKQEYSRTYLIAAVFGILLFLIITPMYKHIGAATAVLTVETFVSIYMYFVLRSSHINLLRK